MCHGALGKVATLLTALGAVAEESVLTNYPSLYVTLLINLDVSPPSTATLPRPAARPPHLCIYEAFYPNTPATRTRRGGAAAVGVP